MLRDVTRSMLAANCPAELVRTLADAGQDVADKLWHRGVELGWMGLAVPEDQDGAGQGVVELALVAEELGATVAPGPFMETAVVAAAVAAADFDARDAVVASLQEGTARAAVATGAFTATTEGDELVVDGRATTVHSAGSVDWLLVTADLDGSPVAVLVESAAATTTRRTTLDQSRGWYDVHCDSVRIPASQVVLRGESAVQHLLDQMSVLVAADALGVGERLLRMTIDYTAAREQFGVAIGSFQAVKHTVADMAKLLKGVHAATYLAAMALDADIPQASLHASVAKAFASEQVSAVAGEALQLHGGIGFTWEHDLHLYLRRAKVDEAIFGNAAAHHERVLALS